MLMVIGDHEGVMGVFSCHEVDFRGVLDMSCLIYAITCQFHYIIGNFEHFDE